MTPTKPVGLKIFYTGLASVYALPFVGFGVAALAVGAILMVIGSALIWFDK